MLSSFATAETNEQTEVRIVVPAEVPHDARISIEDLENTDVDELDMDIPSKETRKTAREWDQGPLKKTDRDWDSRAREKEHG